MKSTATRRFWTQFRALPRGIQDLAIKTIDCGALTRIIPLYGFVDCVGAQIGSVSESEIIIALSAR